MSDERLDSSFFYMVEQAKGLDNFIDYLFDFVERKTEFFSQEERAFKLVNDCMKTHLESWKAAKEKKEKIQREIESN